MLPPTKQALTRVEIAKTLPFLEWRQGGEKMNGWNVQYTEYSERHLGNTTRLTSPTHINGHSTMQSWARLQLLSTPALSCFVGSWGEIAPSPGDFHLLIVCAETPGAQPTPPIQVDERQQITNGLKTRTNCGDVSATLWLK